MGNSKEGKVEEVERGTKVSEEWNDKFKRRPGGNEVERDRWLGQVEQGGGGNRNGT